MQLSCSGKYIRISFFSHFAVLSCGIQHIHLIDIRMPFTLILHQPVSHQQRSPRQLFRGELLIINFAQHFYLIDYLQNNLVGEKHLVILPIILKIFHASHLCSALARCSDCSHKRRTIFHGAALIIYVPPLQYLNELLWRKSLYLPLIKRAHIP